MHQNGMTTAVVGCKRKRPLRPLETCLPVQRVLLVFSLVLSTSRGFLTTKSFPFSLPRRQRAVECHQATITHTHNDFSTAQHNASVPVGLYVHIPYCRRRCRYCDFAIVPIGPLTATEKQTRGFLDMDATYRAAIVQEISSIQQEFNNTKTPLRSIYVGGGTPSLAPIETLEAILNAVLNTTESAFCLQENAEISIEMDPGTFSLSKLQAIKKMGFNRISLGIQSFDDYVLESIGRCHRRSDIEESISLLQQVYGDECNYSIDLISGLPGVALAQWVETLETATSLYPKPRHLSLYDLQVESGTVFGKWYNNDDEEDSDGATSGTRILDQTRGSAPVTVPRLPSPKDCAFAYKYASAYLQAKGYEHYEISSYALKENDGKEVPSPYRSRHNQIYWEPGSQWLAVGLGATSSMNGNRYARPRALTDYISWVENKSTADAFLPASPSQDYDLDVLTDIIMTRLRTSDGLDLDWIKDNVPDGEKVVKKVMKGAKLGLDLKLAEHIQSGRETSMGTLRLVDPDGYLFSNSIISNIFVELGIEG